MFRWVDAGLTLSLCRRLTLVLDSFFAGRWGCRRKLFSMVAFYLWVSTGAVAPRAVYRSIRRGPWVDLQRMQARSSLRETEAIKKSLGGIAGSKTGRHRWRHLSSGWIATKIIDSVRRRRRQNGQSETSYGRVSCCC